MEFKAVRSLRLHRLLGFFWHKCNCTVLLDEFEYKDKLNTLFEYGVYETLPKYPTARVGRKGQKLLSKHRTALLVDLERKVTPYHNRPQHLYVLPKVRKLDFSLSPIVGSTGFAC
jgi:hypothetical protein